jgi:hypothetical protein
MKAAALVALLVANCVSVGAAAYLALEGHPWFGLAILLCSVGSVKITTDDKPAA